MRFLSSENEDDTEGCQYAEKREQKYAGIAEGTDDCAGDRTDHEERDVGEDGVDTESGASILKGDAIDSLDTESWENERIAEAGESRAEQGHPRCDGSPKAGTRRWIRPRDKSWRRGIRRRCRWCG